MDLHVNGSSARVYLEGAFYIEGYGCYDGVPVAQCPQVVRSIGLKGLNNALLGGDYDLSAINVLGVGNIFGKAVNTGNNHATGTATAGDELLAQQWGLAQPGEQNGYLYFSANRINLNNQRGGIVGTLQNNLHLDIDYHARTYSISGTVALPEGNYAYISMRGDTDNLPPVAAAGAERVVCQEADGNGHVQMNGIFRDPDHDNVWYRVGWYDWSADWNRVGWGTLSPTLVLPLGVHHIVLYVWDVDKGAAMDLVRVEVKRC